MKSYSKKDISIWKHTNLICLYVGIKNNIPTFEKNHNTYNDRAESMKQMIKDTLNIHKVNDVDLIINITDNPFNNPFFLSFSSTTNANITTIPNFSFYSWDYPKIDNFFDIKKNILESVISWESKEDKIMWSGLNSNIIRERFNEYTKNNTRYEFNLIESYITDNKFYKLTDHTKYKYLLDFEGTGYSGRFPYLALTGSCVILLENIDPNRDYKLYYSKYFVEDVHYLKVRYSSEDSIESIHNNIINKLTLHDCKKIGISCKELATSIFTLDNILLYMADILNEYSKFYQDSDLILNPDIEFYKKIGSKQKLYKVLSHTKTLKKH
jgi:hypothetical protein